MHTLRLEIQGMRVSSYDRLMIMSEQAMPSWFMLLVSVPKKVETDPFLVSTSSAAGKKYL